VLLIAHASHQKLGSCRTLERFTVYIFTKFATFNFIKYLKENFCVPCYKFICIHANLKRAEIWNWLI
jgi:hypothetical protein